MAATLVCCDLVMKRRSRFTAQFPNRGAAQSRSSPDAEFVIPPVRPKGVNMEMKKVPGSKKTKPVKLYALSTCGWCRKTKDLLNKHKVRIRVLRC